MQRSSNQFPVGRQVVLKGHFNHPVVLEEVRLLPAGFECRVRLPDGGLDEIVISEAEAEALAAQAPDDRASATPEDAERLAIAGADILMNLPPSRQASRRRRQRPRPWAS